eukprot:scaffold229567_cov30-Tisochrysis_lutea.AAC.3
MRACTSSCCCLARAASSVGAGGGGILIHACNGGPGGPSKGGGAPITAPGRRWSLPSTSTISLVARKALMTRCAKSGNAHTLRGALGKHDWPALLPLLSVAPTQSASARTSCPETSAAVRPSSSLPSQPARARARGREGERIGTGCRDKALTAAAWDPP